MCRCAYIYTDQKQLLLTVAADSVGCRPELKQRTRIALFGQDYPVWPPFSTCAENTAQGICRLYTAYVHMLFTGSECTVSESEYSQGESSAVGTCGVWLH